jgi:hypothetical protein
VEGDTREEEGDKGRPGHCLEEGRLNWAVVDTEANHTVGERCL